MTIIDIRFVEMPNGKRLLQYEVSLWGGEGSEWRTALCVPWDSLRDREQQEVKDAIPTEELGLDE